MACQQILPACGRSGREPGVGLLLEHMGAGLRQLLIQIRTVDNRQDLPGLDLAANVGLPALQVAVDPGMDRRLAPGLQMRGQAQGIAMGVLQGLEYVDNRQCGRFGPLAHRVFMAATCCQAIGDQQGRQRQATDAQVHQALARGFLIRRHGKFLQQQLDFFHGRAPG